MIGVWNRWSVRLTGLIVAAVVVGSSCGDSTSGDSSSGDSSSGEGGGTEPLCERATAEAYLVAVDEAQTKVAPDVATGMAKLEEMRLLTAQTDLETLLLPLTESDQERYRTRQTYFEAMQDYVDAWEEDSWEEYRTRYGALVDWDWSEATRGFMEVNNLRLPALGFPIPDDLTTLSPEDVCALAADVGTVVGPDPGTYYQVLIDDVTDTAFYVLESMRKVKSSTKVLADTQSAGFPVMDNIQAPDQPPNEELGMIPMTLVTGWALYEKDANDEYILDEPCEEVIRDRVRNHFTDENMFYVLNVEHWPLTGDPTEVEDSLRKLRLITTWMHDENPNMMLGYYRLLPRRELNAAYQGPDSEAYQSWQAHNDSVAAALEDYLDVLFPSLYGLHLGTGQLTTEERWSIYAQANLAEANRLADTKPVIGFYALYYHPNGTDEDGFTGNPKGWELIEPELLLWQLLTARGHSDEAILYYDLGAGWTALQAAEQPAALALFVQLRANGQLDELESFMVTFIDDHRQELLDKLALEVEMRDLENQRTLAIQDGDTVLADTLTQQILALEAQLAGAIDFWGAVQVAFPVGS